MKNWWYSGDALNLHRIAACRFREHVVLGEKGRLTNDHCESISSVVVGFLGFHAFVSAGEVSVANRVYLKWLINLAPETPWWTGLLTHPLRAQDLLPVPCGVHLSYACMFAGRR